jgi:hypothetical protein
MMMRQSKPKHRVQRLQRRLHKANTSSMSHCCMHTTTSNILNSLCAPMMIWSSPMSTCKMQKKIQVIKLNCFSHAQCPSNAEICCKEVMDYHCSIDQQKMFIWTGVKGLSNDTISEAFIPSTAHSNSLVFDSLSFCSIATRSFFSIPCREKSGNLWRMKVELTKHIGNLALHGNRRTNMISMFCSNFHIVKQRDWSLYFPFVKQTISCLHYRGNSQVLLKWCHVREWILQKFLVSMRTHWDRHELVEGERVG